MKLFFVDLETTGLDHIKHGIWQLAAQIWIDGVEQERFKLEMQPVKGKLVSQEAMTKCNVDMARLRSLPLPHLAFHELRDRLGKYVSKYDKNDKFFFVGYNAQFDNQFLRQWFEDHGDSYFGSWFWYPYIDVCQLAGFCLMKQRRQMENFKLGTVVNHMGLLFDENEAHDADYDIDATRRLFDHLVEQGLSVFD
jgi:DNA polymerase-3 subunit epsilon